jgi:hypothetical protein
MILKKRISYRSEHIKPKSEINYRLPILRGFVIGSSIIIHCPFCDKFHQHGWGPELTARDIYYPGAHCDVRNHPFIEGTGVLYGVSAFRKRDLKAIEARQALAKRLARFRAWKVKQDSDSAVKEESK